MYPTVIDDKVTIEFGNTVDNATIEIYNSLGKICYSKNIENAKDHTLLLEGLCKGVGLIYIKLPSDVVESHRVIIRD